MPRLAAGTTENPEGILMRGAVMPVMYLLCLASSLLQASEVPAGTRALFKQHCTECHDAETKKGNFDLAVLTADFSKPENAERWVQVYDRVASGEMPPKKKARPADAERNAFLTALSKELTAADGSAIAAGGGRTTVRRMNRVEYEHVLRDLLALPLLRVKELLPEDGQQFGFDKVAGALDISYIQMTKYLHAADVALRQAIVPGANRPETKSWHEPAMRQDSARASVAQKCGVPINGRDLAPGLKSQIAGNPVEDYGNSYRAPWFDGEADSFAVLSGVIGAHQPEGIQIDRFRPTVPGWYRVRFSTWGLRWERTHAVAAVRGMTRHYESFGLPFIKDADGRWQSTPLSADQLAVKGGVTGEWQENVEFYGTGETTHIVRASLGGVPLGYFNAPSLKPTTHEFKVWLNPGERVSFHVMTLPGNGAPGGGFSQGVLDYDGPGVAYDWFEVEGPLIEQWPPESQRRLFGDIAAAAYPRPPLDGAPTVDAGATVTLPLTALTGPGQMLGDERFLNTNGTVSMAVNCTVPGDYELEVTAYETHAGDEPARMYLMAGGNEMPHARFNVDALRAAPKKFRARFTVASSGPVTVGVQFVNDFLDEKQTDPALRDRNLFLSHITVTAPAAPPAGTLATKTADHRALLHAFATRAFRRPVANAEIAPYAAIVDARLSRGTGFDEAMIAGYKALLCAPDFLFIGLEAGVPKAGTARLGDQALASRLSFFLWNSAPDAELLTLADKNALSQPATLRAQVERMLSDARAERFAEHFLDEWLELKKIDFTTPDPNLYPEFDPWLRDSMLAEARGYFHMLLNRNLSVTQLVAADTLLINQRLAELYDIRGVTGAELREVPLPDGSPRGGFLTQAAVLKVTANGTATSPVLRGVWVMERLLGIPRQPPPPNIPVVEPDATGAVTIRQMIEKHRADNACASCHAKMDPPGLALESFDVIGGWRERYRLEGAPRKIQKGTEIVEEPSMLIISSTAVNYRSRTRMRLGSEVDSSGELADGRTFADVRGLRALLMKDEDALARNLVRQLLIYATGTGIRFSDRNAIEAIVASTKPTHHGVRDLLHGVVASTLFQTK
jgi:mono/diheme cytochrome c family protein